MPQKIGTRALDTGEAALHAHAQDRRLDSIVPGTGNHKVSVADHWAVDPETAEYSHQEVRSLGIFDIGEKQSLNPEWKAGDGVNPNAAGTGAG